MNKIYAHPQAVITDIEVREFLMASGVSNPERGIDYGGVDEEGEKDPASRRYDVWENEEEEDYQEME